MRQTLIRKGISIVALALGVASIVAAVFALALGESLPYRIGPTYYAQFLWAERLSITTFIAAIAAMILSVPSRRWLPFALGLLSLVSLLSFTGLVHSGPNPQAWCYNNLREIDGAMEQLGLKNNLTNGAVVTSEQISPFIKGGFASLECAEHGRYAINAIGVEPRCTIHGSMSEMEAGWKKEMHR